MYLLIRTQEAFQQALDELDPSKLLFCDTETTEEYGKTKPEGGLYGHIRLFQVYQAGMPMCFIFDCFFVDLEDVLDALQPFHQVYHNASYDLHTINCHTDKTWLPKDIHDTFYLSKAKFPHQQRFGFYECLKYAKLEDDNIRAINKKEEQKSDWGRDLTKKQLTYAAYDVLYLSLLWDVIKDAEDEPYWLDIANLKYAVEYDRHGLPIDQTAIRTLKKDTLLKLEKYKAKVPVNINSSKQCKEWLGSADTTAETLGTMALEGNEDAENLVQARKAYKLLGFLNKYDAPVIKAFHNACGARTSRMTCTGGDRYFYENNQNPPKVLFPCIKAPPGYKIVYKDYSGLELRMAVAYVGEPTMYKLMMEGKDLHTETGCKLFNHTPETLPVHERIVTKFFNFGTAYGAGVATLQSLLQGQGRIHMPFQEVKVVREKWLDLYEYFKEWHAMHKRMYNVYGYVDTTTLLGRDMRAINLTDSFNFPIQGSAAEVTKLAVHYLHTRYKEKPYVINVVHDSIGLLQHEGDESEMWKERLNECMIDSWYEVIKNAAYNDLVMPAEAVIADTWDTEGKYPLPDVG